MTTQNSPQGENLGMTAEECDLFNSSVLDVCWKYENCPQNPDGSYANDSLNQARHELAEYVNTLLAARAAEMARLQARQISPEMIRIASEYQAWLDTDHEPLQALEKGARLQRELANATLKAITGDKS